MKYLIYAILLLHVMSCNNSPIEVRPIDDGNSNESDEVLSNSSIFKRNPEKVEVSDEDYEDVHKVTVLEILETEKYVYLRVDELENEYWIATLKKPMEVGAEYYFTGGLIKENFKSVEYNRVFEELLLVKNIIPIQHGSDQVAPASNLESTQDVNLPEKEGVISIAEIVKNPKDYAGKTIRVQGEVTKINENILGVNWLHLNDGTNDGYDFVLTTQESIQLNDRVVLEGVLSQNKDFGAGYYYPIIVENCKLIN